MRGTIAERFWAKVDKSGPDGCWLWLGCILNGYGNVGHEGRTVRCHRLSWELRFGAIPAGMLVCHRCDNRRCVNPDHLFLGTPLDNMTDMVAKGRAINPMAAACSARTHCPRGHEYVPENIVRHRHGYRNCKTCHRTRTLAHYHATKAART